MLYSYNKFGNHISFRLNRNIIYFFCKLRRVTAASTLAPLADYFSPDFVVFLSKANQQTLRNLFVSFFDAFKALTEDERTETLDKFHNSQKINEILGDIIIDCHNYRLATLPETLKQPAKNLFEYLFTITLNSYGKLKEHYKLIFESLESNICPFCGIELLNNPSIIRQDYDHMMMQSTYVFGTVNMNNLVPTGTECNRINKHSIDALYFNNNRRIFNSPYLNHFDVRISLVGSIPPANLDEYGTWTISILPDNAYTRQWDFVYNIKVRYVDNVLHKFYKNWIKELRTFLTQSALIPIDSPGLDAQLQIQATTLIAHPTTSLANIVKGAFFEFLLQYNNVAYRTSILNYINN